MRCYSRYLAAGPVDGPAHVAAPAMVTCWPRLRSCCSKGRCMSCFRVALKHQCGQVWEYLSRQKFELSRSSPTASAIDAPPSAARYTAHERVASSAAAAAAAKAEAAAVVTQRPRKNGGGDQHGNVLIAVCWQQSVAVEQQQQHQQQQLSCQRDCAVVRPLPFPRRAHSCARKCASVARWRGVQREPAPARLGPGLRQRGDHASLTANASATPVAHTTISCARQRGSTAPLARDDGDAPGRSDRRATRGHGGGGRPGVVATAQVLLRGARLLWQSAACLQQRCSIAHAETPFHVLQVVFEQRTDGHVCAVAAVADQTCTPRLARALHCNLASSSQLHSGLVDAAVVHSYLLDLPQMSRVLFHLVAWAGTGAVSDGPTCLPA
eukprot:363998-Chlamydomonas_euryale.AAC.6